MCEPQIDPRRAENASTSAPVLIGTSHQPPSHQPAPAPGITSMQLGLVRPTKSKNTLVNGR
jgi:hypothetical protein